MSDRTLVTCATTVALPPDQIQQSRLYRDWFEGFRPGWQIKYVRVKVARVRTNNEPFLLVLSTTSIDPLGRCHKVVVLLRGPTVEILPVVTDSESLEQYVVLTEQGRVPASGSVLEIPAGMVEGQTVQAAGSDELGQEVSDTIDWGEILWLGRSLLGTDEPMLVSPGILDETVAFGLVRVTLSPKEIEGLHNRTTGLAAEGEYIRLHVVKLSKVLGYLGSYGSPDLKTFTAIVTYLYQVQLGQI